MKRRLPFFLVLTGTLTLVAAIAVTMGLLVQYTNCDGVSPSVVCDGYTNSIRWAIPLFAIGVLSFIAAGVSATKLTRRTDGAMRHPNS